MVHGKYGPSPSWTTGVDTIIVTKIIPIGARYPFVRLANKALVELTAIMHNDVVMNVPKIWRIVDMEPPFAPISAPAPVFTANVNKEINIFHTVITMNFDSTLYDLGIGFKIKSLIVLSVYSRPNTYAEVKKSLPPARRPWSQGYPNNRFPKERPVL